MQETLPGIERGQKRLGSAHRRPATEVIVGENHNSAPERRPMKISFEAMANANVRPRSPHDRIIENPFVPYQPAPGILPEGKSVDMAMDDCGASPFIGWGGQALYGSLYAEGQTFMGYPELSLMAQRPEYRIVSETLADEATRKWIKIQAADEGEDKSDKIKRIEDEIDRLGVRDCFRKVAEQDGFFGRGHLYLDTGDTDNPQELSTNLGDSFSALSRGKVSPDRPLRAIRNVEAVWTYPTFYNATNPLKKDWYKPLHWYVMGQQVHVSRLLPFIAREVPDLLKPAYAFGGLSLSQMIKPYVDNWLITRQSVQDLIKSFSVFVLKTNMAGTLSGVGGDSFFQRLDMFNATRSNRGLMALDKETEDFANVSASLSGLDHLQAQSQEHICSIAKMPLVKFTGISPSGLNASSEGELRCWEDAIHSYQEAFFDKHLRTIINFIQLSLFGEIDKGITHEWLPINELTEKEAAELRGIDAQTDTILVELGAIDAHEVRQRIAMDDDSPYAGLDVDDMPEMPGAEMGGMPGMPGMEGEEEPGAGGAQPAPAPGQGGAEPAPAPGGGGIIPGAKPPHLNLRGVGNPKSEGGFKPAGDGIAHDAEFNKEDHPRGGNLENPGQFSKGSGSGAGAGESPKAATPSKEEIQRAKQRLVELEQYKKQNPNDWRPNDQKRLDGMKKWLSEQNEAPTSASQPAATQVQKEPVSVPPETPSPEAGKPEKLSKIGKAPAFEPRPGHDLHAEARNYTLEHGKKAGVEYQVTLDKNGKSLGVSFGTSKSVGFGQKAKEALMKPGKAVVMHHNHPSNGALSGDDIGLLAYPGLGSIWAHGHQGNSTKASLTDKAKDRLSTLNFYSKNELLLKANKTAKDAMVDLLVKKYGGAPPFINDRNLFRDTVNCALAEAGIIDYHSSINVKEHFEENGLKDQIQKAADAAKKVYYGQ